MQRLIHAVAVVLLSVAAAPSQGPDWPGFRGPRHDGVSLVAKPPTTWSDDENIRWKVELPGPGSSSPIVADGRVYVACYSGYGSYLDDGGDKEKLVHHLACFSQEDGELLWDTSVPGPLKKEARRIQLTEHGFPPHG